MAKKNQGRQGVNSENVVVRHLNEWAGSKVFRRRGRGQKGDDIVCSWTNWKWKIEVKGGEAGRICPTKVATFFDKECDKKGYNIHETWLIYRDFSSRNLWVAVSIDMDYQLFELCGRPTQRVGLLTLYDPEIYLYPLKDFLASIPAPERFFA